MAHVPDSLFQTHVGFGAVSTSLDGWQQVSGWTLKSIQALCKDSGSATTETCSSGPFSEFTIRGTQGDAMDDGRWWWVNDNQLGLSNYDGGDSKSGGMKIKVRDGYQVKLEFKFETRGEYGFQDRFQDQFSDTSYGVVSKDSDSTIVILKGGDYLDVDIDSDWSGIARFDIKVQGTDLYTNADKSIDDEVYISLIDVYEETPDTGGSGNGGSDSVDCVVSAWNAWSAWSDDECGTRTRNRTVKTPASGGGSVCPHLTEEETKDCETGETTTTTSGGGTGGEGDNNDDGDDSEKTPYLLYGLGGLGFVALLITLKK